ncbi:DNA-binding response OmpR family regulator [Sphingomonas sp. SORGH_AS 950]|uniref:response regulator n=1 Tax=unclassified Sphingomonas TaxID=196159 RepID=UPI00277F282E|nr:MULTISPECIES: response regulator [unclassified Sphingomonas]MDQ1157475.1 DNA-binding response OmpR family regulator [Sphingomonas sp. SORGH_AS_0950]MDR6114635.1 DNA-binding response OmpR family regulator [Sphingomonas sp. SORGH_AS_0789]MDR6147953.1 DNA-binding response OmpR family regulator [Sphingomonas sp. SORGH_AS_0870]MDR6151692.1 DNA-binding response OmpR family regulator [Sphingomonas sp. SORGH_AS_0742]
MSHSPLAEKRILVVEDEYFIARDLERALRAADAIVIGPVATLEQGLALAENEALDAAVLDVNLAGSRAFAIADRLSARDVPWAFLTGYDEWALPAPYRSASIVAKPFHADRVIRAIGALIPDKGCA